MKVSPYIVLVITLILLSASEGHEDIWQDNSGKYLSGYSSGVYKYGSLEQALSQCSDRPDCGGVTYEPYSRRYTLRRGYTLKNSPSGEISWTKSRGHPDLWRSVGGKYLSGYSSGQYRYSSLGQAQDACKQRNDCGGITYEPYSVKYTLRRGSTLKDSPSGEISWIQIADKLGNWRASTGTYLSGYSSGAYRYTALDQAKTECLGRGDCGGITYEPYSSKYTLRRGTTLRTSPSGEISWKRS